MEPPPPPTEGLSPFPILSFLDPSKPHTFAKPTKRINDGDDVSHFLTSEGYRDIGLFIMQLNRAMCPRKVPGPDGKEVIRMWTKQEAAPPAGNSVRRLQEMLAKAESFLDEAPPDPGPRRFGNVSFRKWLGILEDRTPALMKEFLADVAEFGKEDEGDGSMDELMAYFLGGFGSAQRLDYGTGHELSFIAFLGCLWKLGFFKDGQQNGPVERSIILGVFEP
jgi:serine/threonine-protein phosphatase 2A activator